MKKQLFMLAILAFLFVSIDAVHVFAGVIPINMTATNAPVPFIDFFSPLTNGGADMTKCYQAFDNNDGTPLSPDCQMAANTTGAGFLGVDLGQNYTLVNFTLYSQYTVASGLGANQYAIQGSVDNVTWVGLYLNTTADSWTTKRTWAINGTYRYMRLTNMTNAGDHIIQTLSFGVNTVATALTNMTISVNDTRANALVSGFTWSYNTTNASDTSTKTGYCATTSCSLTNFTGTLNVTVTNVSGGNYFNPFDSPKNLFSYNTTSNSYTFQAYNMSATGKLVVNAYLSDANYSQNFSLGQLVFNQTYTVGVLIGKSNVTRHRYAVVFNGTALADTKDASTSIGYPFRTNASCSDASSTCINSIAYGGMPNLNASYTPTTALQTINGTIDELISGYYNNYPGNDNIDAMSPAFLIAWGTSPTMAFSSTYISNIYAPVISLFATTPSSPTFSDNINASLSFADNDFETLSNVTFQWRVNGSLIRTTIVNVTGVPFNMSDLLRNGNYSKGATVNITVWGTDGLYTTANQSIQFVIGGIRPAAISSLACGAINKTSVNCNWTNPSQNVSNITLNKNASLITVVSNTTTTYNFSGLLPDQSYNFSFITTSFDGTNGNTTSNITNMPHNYAPNITSYTPSNLTPLLQENITQNFTVNVTDDDNNPIVAWFKDNVFQNLGNFFTWAIGLNEQGNHTIVAIANDTYGATTNVTWSVTVNDTFPPPHTPVFTPNTGSYRVSIPVKCISSNSYSAVNYYNMSVSVNNGATTLFSQFNKMGFSPFDITQYDYGTNFTFSCSAVGDAGNANGTSGIFKKDYVNEFYSTTTENDLQFSTMTPYTFALYYDAQKPGRNVTVQYAFADCNGDALYDYVYNYTGVNPARIKQRYDCVFPSGIVKYQIGVFLQKASTDSWAGTGCSTDYDYSGTCLVTKTYQLVVT